MAFFGILRLYGLLSNPDFSSSFDCAWLITLKSEWEILRADAPTYKHTQCVQLCKTSENLDWKSKDSEYKNSPSSQKANVIQYVEEEFSVQLLNGLKQPCTLTGLVDHVLRYSFLTYCKVAQELVTMQMVNGFILNLNTNYLR